MNQTSMLVEALQKIANECTSNEVSISFIEHEAKTALESYKDGWVSVEERLPPVGRIVLAYHATYSNAKTNSINENGKWSESVNGINTDVTHWQPLPTPPQTKTI